MIIPHVWSDERGDSHFADLELVETIKPTAPGLPDMRSTDLLPLAGFRLITTSAEAMAQGWHPAPGRQFVIVAKGSIAVEVPDGETRRLNTGSIIFFEDTHGKGHLNHPLDDRDILLAFLVAPDDWHPEFRKKPSEQVGHG